MLATGATGQNAVYNSKTGMWSTAPSFPVIAGQQYDIADGPAAVLPDGQVLLDASPGEYQTPAQFFLYNPAKNTLAQITNPPNAASTSSYYAYLLVLPTGQILYNDRFGDVDLYNAGGVARATWAPVISSVSSTTLVRGTAYQLSGTQLNGLTQGAAYGDDFQDATNYPLVRLTYASGRVVYAATSAMSSMSVKPKQASTVTFSVPSGAPTGTASLSVVTNGIPSQPLSVSVT